MKHAIEIAGTSFPLKFGFGAFKLLGNAWDCKGIQSVINEFQKIIPTGKEPDVTFEAADKLADVAFAGISNAGVKELPDSDECIEALLFGGQLEPLMIAFQESLPQGNPQPVKTNRQTKKAKKK
ncbi:MAG TPA: hypothetical protein VFM70_02680 [Salinimicrobium sp.]|nr:hypothetical protein [Salinimicrobium sp.]